MTTRGETELSRIGTIRIARRVPLTEEQRELAVNYSADGARSLPSVWMHDLAGPIAKSWSRRRIWHLVEAAQTFDPSVSVGFGTYARHRIRGALRDFQRLIYSGGSRAVGGDSAGVSEAERI